MASGVPTQAGVPGQVPTGAPAVGLNAGMGAAQQQAQQAQPTNWLTSYMASMGASPQVAQQAQQYAQQAPAAPGGPDPQQILAMLNQARGQITAGQGGGGNPIPALEQMRQQFLAQGQAPGQGPGGWGTFASAPGQAGPNVAQGYANPLEYAQAVAANGPGRANQRAEGFAGYANQAPIGPMADYLRPADTDRFREMRANHPQAGNAMGMPAEFLARMQQYGRG